MDQIAMCKKSQQVSSKNNEVNKDISNTKTIGLAEGINFKITIKYVPTVLPDNPNPIYDVSVVDINEK